MSTEKSYWQLHDRVTAMRKELRKIRQRWAEDNCPIQVDQIVECVGYTYTGRRMRVTDVYALEHTTWNAGLAPYLQWQVKGVVLKKNGDDSKQTASFSQRDWERHIKQGESEQ